MTAGLALITGALAGVVTMSLHPTGRDLLQSGEQAAHAAWRNAAVHWLALASLPLLILGFLGLSRLLGLRRAVVSAAFITYALGCAAAMCAAIMSGLVAPSVARQILSADQSSRSTFEALLHYTGDLNQGFAKVYVAASSAAVILWSASILRTRALAGAAGTLGCLIGGGSLLALASGHLRLNVHGFGLFVVAQSAWIVLVGVLLCRVPDAAAIPKRLDVLEREKRDREGYVRYPASLDEPEVRDKVADWPDK
ncbi:MAG TPA: hypothetical protein VLO07_08280 [Thermoanaerobaculia bacterium]|nr:hypothetical protein [Thermoanaerobaculia bacterium]